MCMVCDTLCDVLRVVCGVVHLFLLGTEMTRCGTSLHPCVTQICVISPV